MWYFCGENKHNRAGVPTYSTNRDNLLVCVQWHHKMADDAEEYLLSRGTGITDVKTGKVRQTFAI